MRAVDDVKPYFNVRARRVGGSTFQVPYIIKDHRRRALAITWIIQAATMKKKKFPKKKFHRFLVEEVLESLVPKKKPRPNATKKNSTSKKSNPTKKNNANRENIIARLGLEK
jgi:ribosomal protein S7